MTAGSSEIYWPILSSEACSDLDFLDHFEIGGGRAGDVLHLGDQTVDVLAGQPTFMGERLIDRVHQRPDAKGFEEMMMGFSDAAGGVFRFGDVGKHDAVRRRLPGHEIVENLQSAHVGQKKIRDDDGEGVLLRKVQGFLAGFGGVGDPAPFRGGGMVLKFIPKILIFGHKEECACSLSLAGTGRNVPSLHHKYKFDLNRLVIGKGA